MWNKVISLNLRLCYYAWEEPSVPLVNSPAKKKFLFFQTYRYSRTGSNSPATATRRPVNSPATGAHTARRNPTKGNRSSLLLVRDLQVCCCSPRHQPPPRICKRHAFSHSGSKPACSAETTQAGSVGGADSYIWTRPARLRLESDWRCCWPSDCRPLPEPAGLLQCAPAAGSLPRLPSFCLEQSNSEPGVAEPAVARRGRQEESGKVTLLPFEFILKLVPSPCILGSGPQLKFFLIGFPIF